MKLALLGTFCLFLLQSNCQEIENKSVKIGTSYNISCKIQDLEHVQGCWLENPMGSLKILWSGSKWERGRLKKLDQEDLCGVHVTKAIPSDEGIWKCILAIGKQDETINDVTNIEVKVEQDLLPKLKMQNNVDPLISKEKKISLQSVSIKYISKITPFQKFHDTYTIIIIVQGFYDF